MPGDRVLRLQGTDKVPFGRHNPRPWLLCFRSILLATRVYDTKSSRISRISRGEIIAERVSRDHFLRRKWDQGKYKFLFS